MATKKNTEEVIPMVDAANKEVLDYAQAEEAEANKLFYESQGLEPDGKTPLEEEPEAPPADKPKEKKEEKPEEKPEGKPEGKPEEKPEGKPEGKPDDDLTKDLTVENANNRISAAQNKMHSSNKTAKDAVERQNKLQEENEALRKLVDEKATEAPSADAKPDADPALENKQTEDDVEKDLEGLRTEYPEIAEPMIKMMQKMKAENQAMKTRLDKVDDRETKRVADAKLDSDQEHYNAIAEVHGDFAEISQEPLLDEWIEGLPPMEKVGAKEIRKGGTTKEVISLLTSFKTANGYKVPGDTPTEKPNTKLEKAKKHATPQFNKAKEVNTQDKQIRFTQEQISKWTEKEWTENEPAVNEAMKLGLVR